MLWVLLLARAKPQEETNIECTQIWGARRGPPGTLKGFLASNMFHNFTWIRPFQAGVGDLFHPLLCLADMSAKVSLHNLVGFVNDKALPSWVGIKISLLWVGKQGLLPVLPL